MVKESVKKTKLKPTAAAGSSLIVGSGEMAELMRRFDWKKSHLPRIENWPRTLLTTVNLILQSPVPIVMLWGADGIMLYNDAYSIFAGQRHPQLLGSKVIEGWPEVADFNRHVMQEVFHKCKTLSYKDQQLTLYRNNRPEEVWMDLNYSPIIGDSGKPEGVFAIVTETTGGVLAEQGRHDAEKALLEEKERLQTLLMQAPAMIAFLRGQNHVYEMANQLYIKTFAPGQDIIGKPLVKVFPELKGQEVMNILDKALHTGIAYIGELSVKLDRSGSGELENLHFNVVYQPVHLSDNKKFDGIFVHAVDISEQKKNLERAERLSAELSAIFESLPDGVYTLDKEKVTHVNQRGAEMLGYGSPEEVPKHIATLYEDLARKYTDGTVTVDPTNTTVGRAFAGEVTSHIGVRLKNPLTGEERVVRSAAAPIKDNAGNVIGAVATTSDITEQYNLQAKMQKEMIRRRVLSQKARLLRAQNEQLTALNETKDEFIALTSHQLRTPATGVKQYVGMIIQGFAGDITPQQRDFLERAYESNDRQLQIIDDILRVARIDLDQIVIKKQKQDIAGLLHHIVNEQGNTFTSRKQTVLLNVPNEPVYARVDAHNISMAIGNIIDNASKYTADNKEITISLEKQGRSITIRVCDQGVGIAQKDISKLFQKFSRIPNERSIEVGGTGLGLYLSNKLIEKHRGTIQIESKAGIGTTFTITLPA